MIFTPTDEQLRALELFGTGGSLGIEAGAGSGKTSTLKMLAESCPNRTGQYVAFNKAIVTDSAAKFPGTVQCSTAHSLAFRAVGKRFSHRLNSPRMRSMELARRLGVDPFTITTQFGKKVLQPAYLASLVMRAVTLFCQSADLVPGPEHVPYVDGIDLPTEDGRRTYGNNRQVREHLRRAIARAWADLSTPDGALPYKHEHYLKTWQLSGPRIARDFILFDEAQDASPVLLAAVMEQAQYGAQIVLVGDSQQCQPPESLVLMVGGELRPLGEVRVGERVVTYRVSGGSFRRVGRTITAVSSRPYEGPLVVVEAGQRISRYTPNHWCLVRGSAMVGRSVVYVMRRNNQYRVGCSSWAYGAGAGPVVRARQEGADAVWVLSAHESKREGLIAEAVAAGRFGLPTITFAPVNGGIQLDAGALDRIWSGIGDNAIAAKALLEAYGKDVSWPLWQAGDLYEATARRPMRIRASNLISGMEIRLFEPGVCGRADGAWHESTVWVDEYVGSVVSLDVDQDHNYVADGIVTFNSIYGFTGAVDALKELDVEHRAMLSRSFRFGEAIADTANRVLCMIPDAEIRLAGSEDIASIVGPVGEPDAVLARTNATAVKKVLQFQQAGGRPHLVGGGDDVRRFAEAAADLMEERGTTHPDLACFDTWPQVQEYVENDPSGGELRLLVRLVDEFGVDTIKVALGRMPREDAASVIVSTAHKAKGREWASVQLAGDFCPAPKDTPPDVRYTPDHSELRLLYVAVTRARLELDESMVELFSALRVRDAEDDAIRAEALL